MPQTVEYNWRDLSGPLFPCIIKALWSGPFHEIQIAVFPLWWMLSMPGEFPIICFALHLLIGLQVDGRGEKGSLNKSWLHDGREWVTTCAPLSSNFRKSIESEFTGHVHPFTSKDLTNMALQEYQPSHKSFHSIPSYWEPGSSSQGKHFSWEAVQHKVIEAISSFMVAAFCKIETYTFRVFDIPTGFLSNAIVFKLLFSAWIGKVH